MGNIILTEAVHLGAVVLPLTGKPMLGPSRISERLCYALKTETMWQALGFTDVDMFVEDSLRWDVGVLIE